MRIAGLETHEVDVWRPTLTERTEGDDERVYDPTALKTNCPVRLQQATSGREQRSFGTVSEPRYRVLFDKGLDLRPDDVLVIVAGEFGVGQALLVLDVKERATFDGDDIATVTETNDGPP